VCFLFNTELQVVKN